MLVYNTHCGRGGGGGGAGGFGGAGAKQPQVAASVDPAAHFTNPVVLGAVDLVASSERYNTHSVPDRMENVTPAHHGRLRHSELHAVTVVTPAPAVES
jgi:hypothetical protein